MMLKEKMFELIEHITYNNWATLEEQIMQGNINAIEQFISN
jgi:hypothetical protein